MEDQPARRYDEKEVTRLLRRASEIQRASPTAPNPTGMSLRELEEIAREAGLDVASLREAARELDAGGRTQKEWGRRLAGAATATILDCTIPRVASADELESLLPLIESAANISGHPSSLRNTLSWYSADSNSGRKFQIRVTVRSDTTHVRIEERYGGLAGGLFGGMLGGGGGGLGLGAAPAIGMAMQSVLLAVAFPIVVVGGFYWGARKIFTTVVNDRRRVLERLIRDIETTLAARQLSASE